MKINVSTPQGMKFHGEIIDGWFVREVDYEKDRMRIFDAWSIHPDAIKEISGKVEGLKYKCGEEVYTITTAKAHEKGFYKEFSGGKTFYIPIKFWEKLNKNEQKLL